jgi:hypothetical protein
MNEDDLTGIMNLMRRHIEIRNRSWLKRIHRDCFIGSDAVDFLVTQGFADTRKAAVEMGLKMTNRKLIRNITDSRKFSDTLHYYRFTEDDNPVSVLARNNAGNGLGAIVFGHGGCKWSFAPHTAHNSYVLDIGLAEEIERAVAGMCALHSYFLSFFFVSLPSFFSLLSPSLSFLGASIEARLHAIQKLRNRVREQAEPDAPNWDLIQSQSINGAIINVFQRKRPRGDWKNIKLTGVVAESPIGFIKSIMNFEKRKQWESLFEDGVIIEGIETGEKPSALLLDEELGDKGVKEGDKGAGSGSGGGGGGKTTAAGGGGGGLVNVAVPESVKQQQSTTTTKLARTTDDVYTFLQTVDMAGIPHGMAIAFLNDPERQHALAHLRKQMMLSNPQECMLCQTPFDDATDIRFCPCCAMVSCAGCVSKRVFEVVSRNVMSVCIHCYRESSRIFQPPQALQDDTTIDESLRGKWWRPEVLGILDYSNPSSAPSAASVLSPSATGGNGKASSSAASTIATASRTNRESMNIPSIYNDQDILINTTGLRPLIPGLFDDLTSGVTSPNATSPIPSSSSSSVSKSSNRTDPSLTTIDGGELSEGEEIDDDELPISATADLSLTSSSPPKAGSAVASSSPPPPIPPAASSSSSPPPATTPPSAPLATTNPALAAKMARCKSCGLLISRDIEAIEQHQEECMKTNQSRRTASVSGFIRSSIASIAGSPGGTAATLANDLNKTYTISPESSNISVHHGNHKQFAGIPRNPEAAKKYATRIIYRTARPDLSSTTAGGKEQAVPSPTPSSSNPSAPREVCVLQDCFVDNDGTAYLYEISVRHSEIRGITDYITADVMLLLHIAKPIKGNKTASQICIINQIDSHAKSSALFSFGGESSKNKDIAGLRKEDLVRELKMCADLPNLLSQGQEDYSDESNVSLDDFELLAVLGRGGFGKVMQVRFKTSNIIYAMKILKKSELRRRRQVRAFLFLLLSLF